MGRKLAIEFFLVALVGLTLGLIGPFGTYEFPAAVRIAYWVVFGTVGYAIFRPLGVVGGWMSEMLGISRVIGVGLSLVVAALPMTLIVAALIWKFDVAAALRWNGLPGLYFEVWLIGFLTHGLFALIFRTRAETSDVATANEPRDVPAGEGRSSGRFEDRLPPGFGALLALRGEDHYVRAIGAAREEMILIRLRDAINELQETDGLQVHRSWWVARSGVKSVRRDGREAVIQLSNGKEVPVSRERMAALRSAGWI